MTKHDPYQYNCLTEVHRKALLLSKGTFVSSRKDGELSVLLYQLYSFHVEAFYSKELNEVQKIRSFSTTEQLQPYLDQIDISTLLE